MRTLRLFTASLVAVLGVAFSAQADPIVNLVWTGTTGSGTTGGSSISAAVGDTLTLRVDLVLATPSGPLTATAPGFIWDQGGTSVLDWSASNKTAIAGLTLQLNDGVVTQSGAPEAGGGGYAQATLAQSVFLGAGIVAANQTVSPGSLVFVVTGTGSTVVSPGLFNPVFDSLQGPVLGSNYVNAVFNSASVNVVPEPGTAALLALGLGALTVAGRRRKA
jgi:hypothetical protein